MQRTEQGNFNDTLERNPELAERMMYSCIKKGLAFKIIEGNIITLRPSLVLTKDEIDFSIKSLEESITESSL